MSVPVALPAALTYGVADFAGGLAARRAPVLVVTAAAQAAGLLSLLPVVGLVAGRPSSAALVIGALAGVAGASGLLLYLRALAVGPMGVVAPLSAVISAGLPLVVGLLGGELLGPVAVLAIGLALVAILLATAGTRRDAAASTGLLLGLAAGAGFGLFFVGLDATPPDSGLWPLLAGRVVSVTLLLGLVLRHRLPLPTRTRVASLASEPGESPVPTVRAARPRTPWRLMVVSGVCDTLANVLFLVATRLGDLAISAVVVSLYPVVVVVLARVLLSERLTRTQLLGAGLALAASVLLAVA
ncbi:EamA family transporter [Pseudonocardia kunmingensis]|uniref:EamA-like transporter family protein n=1 Tax=Pseudonocardia kunmingensis TaxID=630975 RepID=A0A543D9E8_9PSEU|nr:EamA family transporter [Pseudonocardia kunmingensis]TQM05963.1 EamA-like transporter family protein [Pseudonocardia kunmingensis]